MATLSESPPPETIGFFLVPDFPMLAFSAVVEPLRIANWIAGKELCTWRIMTGDGRPVRASNGCLLTPQSDMSDIGGCSHVIVCAGVGGCYYEDRQVFAWLRSLARRGIRLGGVCTATYILARAGVLAGHRCTIHWEDIETLRAEFPDLEVTDGLYEIDGSCLTCGGGMAAMDMMLDIIGTRHGSLLAGEIADQFMKQPQRVGSDRQRMQLDVRTGLNDKRLLAAIGVMENHLEDPLDLNAVCESSGVSPRHLQRLFIEQLGGTFGDFYRSLRLRHARHLLLHGSDSILDVAIASGFVSTSHFTRLYRAHFGLTPGVERRRQRETRASRSRRP